MAHATKMTFITNMCTHYVIMLFELLSREYDVDFYFTGGDEPYWNIENKLGSGNIRGHYLKKNDLLSRLRFIPSLWAILPGKADVFIKTIDGRYTLPFVFIGVKLLRKPFVLWTGLWAHPGTFLHRISFPFVRFIYHHADAIVVYGDHVKRYLTALGVQPTKIFCAPHAIDNSIMNKPVRQEQIIQLRGELGLSGEKVILYVGRFEKCKGLNFLIDALSRIKCPDFTVLLIGNGSQEEALRSKCNELSVKCRFLGHVTNEDLYPYYALADIFVLPSITTKDFKEPWGLVINEAMNQGCPIVTTDAVGAAAGGLVENGQNGFIVPEKDSAALREVIEELLNNSARRVEMGRHAREKITAWTPQQTLEGFKLAVDYAVGAGKRKQKWS